MKRPGKELEKYWYAGLTGFFVIVAALVVYAITSNLTGLGTVIYLFRCGVKFLRGKRKKHQMLRGDVPCFVCFFWRYLLCLEL